jgi:hypothetical protein
VLVPFGRYRGRSVEDLTDNRAYCDWLLRQAWFPRLYPELRAIVAQRWPPHNAEPITDPIELLRRRPKSFRRRKRLDPRLLCRARTRAGGFCQRRKAPGKKRCVQHGGAPRSGRPVGYPEHPNTAAARKAWYARVWELKRAGKISRFPQGTKHKATLTAPRVEKKPDDPAAVAALEKQIFAAIEELKLQQRSLYSVAPLRDH